MKDTISSSGMASRWSARSIGYDSDVTVAAFAFLIFIIFLFLFGTSPAWASNGKIVLTCSGQPVYNVGDTIFYTLSIDNTSTSFGGPFDMENVDCRFDLPSCVGHPTEASISQTNPDGSTFTPDIRVYYDTNIHQVFSILGTVRL